VWQQILPKPWKKQPALCARRQNCPHRQRKIGPYSPFPNSLRVAARNIAPPLPNRQDIFKTTVTPNPAKPCPSAAKPYNLSRKRGLWKLNAKQASTFVIDRVLVWCYGYATEYKKSVHAKCFLNSWYFRGYGPGYGMLFRLFSAILRYSPLFAAILGPECLVDFLFKVFLIFGSVPVVM